MSLGVPVVSMNCPPGPEIVEDGVTGLLADPMSPEDFNQKISAILDDNNFARILAENAKLHVNERFSFKKCLEATEKFYEKCLNDKGGFRSLEKGYPEY
jgi:glycosyltransferase involved in cell wall biosynthesis